LGLLLELQIGIPPLEDRAEFVIESFHPRLQYQMGPTLGPLHLLPFAEAFSDHLVDRGFDKAGADVLPIPIPLSVIGDEGSIAVNIRVKLLQASG
jgi:hypothetical protein